MDDGSGLVEIVLDGGIPLRWELPIDWVSEQEGAE